MKRFLFYFFIFICVLHATDGLFKNLPDIDPDATMNRRDIPAVYKWDLSDLCKNEAAWNNEIKQSQKELEILQNQKSDLDSPKGLMQYLKTYFKLDDQINRLTLYANLQREVETTNQEYISRHELALNLTEELMREGAPLRQAILGLSQEEMQQYIKEEPEIKDYLPYIKNLRRRADRVLSPREEQLLSLAGDNLWAQIDINELPAAPEKAFRSLTSEMTFPAVKNENGKYIRLTFANYGRLRGSSDREVRKEAVKTMFETLKNLENTFATTLGEQAKFSLFLSKARMYDTVLEAYLDKDDLNTAVYTNLINTVRAHVKPLHKYIELRKKALGYDDIHLYDLYVPMVEQKEIKMDYNTGVRYILDALKPLGQNYINQVKTGMNPRNGWIDLYPSSDKNSGAFSTATHGIHPYVKMNYQNTFDDVSTLAHEYGHAMHSFYAISEQSYLTWRYSPFLAEIASTCNEALLSKYMIKNAKSKEEKAWLLSELLETIRTTIYRQTLFAEFELKLHQLAEAGEPITASGLNKIYEDLIKIYYGSGYTMDEYDHIEWAYIPHFYYKYYVFTYATGLSSGIAFAEKITQEGKDAREAYMNMLKGGSSKPPLELLRQAGLDLTKPEAIESALNLFDKTLDELDMLIGK